MGAFFTTRGVFFVCVREANMLGSKMAPNCEAEGERKRRKRWKGEEVRRAPSASARKPFDRRQNPVSIPDVGFSFRFLTWFPARNDAEECFNRRCSRAIIIQGQTKLRREGGGPSVRLQRRVGGPGSVTVTV